MDIHPTAVIDAGTELADGIKVGAYSVIGKNVKIGADTEIGPHVVIKGPCSIGANNRFFQFGSIGEEPQDLKFFGEPSTLKIGDNNTFREFVTLNRGTENGGGATRIGSNNLLMAYVHVAHDCIIGDNNIFANNTSLAGHITIENNVTLGGFTLISQFLKIGSYAFSAMSSVINKHVPPFIMVSGHMAHAIGINTIGLERQSFSKQEIKDLRKTFRIFYKSDLNRDAALAKISDISSERARKFREFIQGLNDSKIGIIG